MRKLLRFLVEETAAGRGDELKAYGVAVDGLGRDADFDPQADSYPRVQVGRLRRMIDQFYAEEGIGPDGLRIAIPRGSYRVRWDQGERSCPFSSPSSVEMTPLIRRVSRPGRHAVLVGALILCGLIVAVLWNIMSSRHTSATTAEATLPFSGVIPPPLLELADVRPVEGADPVVAQRIDRSLGDALHRSWVFTVRPAGTQKPRPEYSLTGTLVGGQRQLLYITLWDSRNSTQLWSERLELGASDPVRDRLGPVLNALMSPFGVIGTRERHQSAGDFTPGFPCMMRYAEYYLDDPTGLFRRVDQCLSQTLERDPGNSPALLARLRVKLREGARGTISIAAARRDALALARRAVDADPFSADASMAMAIAAYANGMCDLGRASSLQAVERNPFDGYNQASTGMFRFQCGDRDFEEVVRRGWALDDSLPAIAAVPILVGMSERGEGKAALRFALRLPVSEGYRRPRYDLTMAIAYTAAGQLDEARERWRMAADGAGAGPGALPSAVLEHIVMNRQLVDRLESYLSKRGLFNPPSQQLNRATAR